MVGVTGEVLILYNIDIEESNYCSKKNKWTKLSIIIRMCVDIWSIISKIRYYEKVKSYFANYVLKK